MPNFVCFFFSFLVRQCRETSGWAGCGRLDKTLMQSAFVLCGLSSFACKVCFESMKRRRKGTLLIQPERVRGREREGMVKLKGLDERY